MKGDKDVKLADVVNVDMGMTMMVMIGRDPNALIEMTMLVFQKDSCSYPIRDVPNDVPGVYYRSGKVWMDRRVFSSWISEKRIFRKLPNGEKRTFYVDNAAGHKMSDEIKQALHESNTEIRYLPDFF